MRVSSEETLKRVRIARRSGKSWIELTRSASALENGLEFFSGTKPAVVPRPGRLPFSGKPGR